MATTTTTTEEQGFSTLPIEKSRSVPATFNYWGTSDPPEIREIQTVFSGQSSKLRSVPTSVHDIRPIGLNAFNLTDNGFQILQSSSSLLPPQSRSVPDFHDERLMRSKYWPELVSLLKSQLGVRAAVAINTTVRDIAEAPKNEFRPENPRANPNQSFFPFFVVHADYTPAGARSHMRAMLPSFFADNDSLEATSEEERREFFKLREEILAAEDNAMSEEGVSDLWEWSGKNYRGPRWAMLSVWRPLETVRRDPLGVMDPRSLFRKDGKKNYMPFPRMYKERPGFEKEYKSENLMPVAPEKEDQYRWYYVSEQRPEEVYALKLFDSEAHKESGKAVECSAHSAFSLPNQENAELRRSAEVRVMIVW